MSRVSAFFPLLFVLVIPECCANALGQEPTASEYLDRSLRAHDYSQRLYVEEEAEVHDFRLGKTDVVLKSKVSSRILRKGELFEVKGDKFFLEYQDQSFSFASIANAELSVNTSNRHSMKGKPVWASITQKRPQKELIRNLQDANLSWALDGYFEGSDGVPVQALMKQSADRLIRPQTEDIDGDVCKVVEAKTKCGRITLWLSIANGCLIKKAVQSKGQEDIFYDKQTLADLNAQPVMQSRLGFVAEWRMTLDKIGFAKRDGRAIPVEGSMLVEFLSKEMKQVNYIKTRFVRKVIDLNPDFAARSAFRVDLPNGTRVQNLDHEKSGVQYEWRDGKVVPLYSEFTGGVEGGWSGRSVLVLLLWAVPGLLLLFLAFRYFYSRRKAP